MSRSLSETVIFCGRQGIALRGHRDDWKHVDEQSYANPGNFVALVQFKIQSGDKVLADHLASCGRYSLYTSKTTQNELIGICGSNFFVICNVLCAWKRRYICQASLADEERKKGENSNFSTWFLT